MKNLNNSRQEAKTPRHQGKQNNHRKSRAYGPNSSSWRLRASKSWCFLAFAILAIHTPAAVVSTEPVEGIVMPSKQVVLNAPLPSILKEFRVKEGDRVEKGQPLAYMDDGLQQVAVKSAELQATSMTAIRTAE